jgi:hypothetical protein
LRGDTRTTRKRDAAKKRDATAANGPGAKPLDKVKKARLSIVATRQGLIAGCSIVYYFS